ncbi:DNA-binding protein snt1 [Basidiobolus ranarum]|uniref:DNA-binding protein snt1 n=1 Tax=Basidiobolus ranarum TaxID=34480 RepID=A0ABR2VXD6_9FUNG
MEIIQYLENEELRNPDVRSMRTAAKIPSMILDPSKRELTQYDNRNNLVEDPFNYYHCNSSVDEWTDEEREIFIKRYLQYPKQFGKIASFFKNKNPRQCVLFYYREKKSIDFKRLISGKEKKKRRLTRKGAGKRIGKRKKSQGSSLVEDIEEAERTNAPDEFTGSQSFSDGRMSKESDSVPASPEAQKWPKKSRGKYPAGYYSSME